MSRSVYVFISAVIVLAASWAAPDAAAQSDDERARRHFDAGQSYYEQARYEDAIREWNEAFALSGRDVLLLNLSQAYERNLQYQEAIEAIDRYLAAVPDTPDRNTLERRRERLGDLRERVEVRGAAESVVGEAAPTPSGRVEPVNDERTGGGIGALGVLGFAFAGLAVASAVVALATGIASDGIHSDLEARCDPDEGCPVGSQADIDEGQTLAVVSTVFTGVAVVAAVTGVTFLTLELTSGEQEDERELSLTPGPGEVGLGLVGRW